MSCSPPSSPTQRTGGRSSCDGRTCVHRLRLALPRRRMDLHQVRGAVAMTSPDNRRRREDAARALSDWINDPTTPDHEIDEALAELAERNRQRQDRERGLDL